MKINKEGYPLVSIVIPTYNQNAIFLRECIESAINQTYPNIEVIVSNNWSTLSHVQQILDEFSLNSRLVLIKPEKHLSMVDHFVFAAEQAKGKYLSFLSSDDLLEINAIQMLFDGMSKYPDTKMAFGEVRYADAVSLNHIYFSRDYKLKEGNYTAKEFLQKYITNHSVWMVGNLVDKEEYKNLGGIKAAYITYCHDIAFIFKWLNNGNSIYYVNGLTSTCRVWRDENQKADNNRELKIVSDFIEIYKSIMKWDYILKAVGYKVVLKKKQKDFEAMALHWSVKYIKKMVSREDFSDVKNQINKHNKSWKISLYFLCCQPILKYFINNTYYKLKNK